MLLNRASVPVEDLAIGRSALAAGR
jgi:hypothetical protein